MKRHDRSPALGSVRGAAERVFGDLRVRFLVNEPRARPFSVLHIRIPPYGRHEAIRHSRTGEFFLVLQGRVKARVGAARRVLRAGDWGYLPPGTPHEFQAGRREAKVISVFAPAMDFRRPDIQSAER